MSNKSYKITTDVFTLPRNNEEVILYAPLVGFTGVVNNDIVNLLAEVENLNFHTLTLEQQTILEYLEKQHILNGENFSCISPKPECYEPTRLTLFPTNQCNLRCVYCYASAGDDEKKKMPINLATLAIEYVIKNIKKKKLNLFAMGFHGGGEPFFAWDFITSITDYVEKRCEAEGLQRNIYSATNGVLNPRQLEWIVEHFKSLNVSFDGLPQVQNYHRPLPNGTGSFKFVDRTMRFLDDHNFRYGIRCTVSEYNLELMFETLDFIGQNYKCKQVHFEPSFYCGRCKTSNTMNPNMQRFAENFMQCENMAGQYGIELIYSGSHLNILKNSFCGVSADNFSITPEGYITSCFECTTIDDPKSKYFFLGRIEKNGTVVIDPEKRNFLNSLTVDQLDYCQDCFAKWHCAGECAAKVDITEIKGARGHERCLLNRELLAGRISRLLENEQPVKINC